MIHPVLLPRPPRGILRRERASGAGDSGSRISGGGSASSGKRRFEPTDPKMQLGRTPGGKKRQVRFSSPLSEVREYALGGESGTDMDTGMDMGTGVGGAPRVPRVRLGKVGPRSNARTRGRAGVASASATATARRFGGPQADVEEAIDDETDAEMDVRGVGVAQGQGQWDDMPEMMMIAGEAGANLEEYEQERADEHAYGAPSWHARGRKEEPLFLPLYDEDGVYEHSDGVYFEEGEEQGRAEVEAEHEETHDGQLELGSASEMQEGVQREHEGDAAPPYRFEPQRLPFDGEDEMEEERENGLAADSEMFTLGQGDFGSSTGAQQPGHGDQYGSRRARAWTASDQRAQNVDDDNTGEQWDGFTHGQELNNARPSDDHMPQWEFERSSSPIGDGWVRQSEVRHAHAPSSVRVRGALRGRGSSTPGHVEYPDSSDRGEWDGVQHDAAQGRDEEMDGALDPRLGRGVWMGGVPGQGHQDQAYGDEQGMGDVYVLEEGTGVINDDHPMDGQAEQDGHRAHEYADMIANEDLVYPETPMQDDDHSETADREWHELEQPSAPASPPGLAYALDDGADQYDQPDIDIEDSGAALEGGEEAAAWDAVLQGSELELDEAGSDVHTQREVHGLVGARAGLGPGQWGRALAPHRPAARYPDAAPHWAPPPAPASALAPGFAQPVTAETRPAQVQAQVPADRSLLRGARRIIGPAPGTGVVVETRAAAASGLATRVNPPTGGQRLPRGGALSEDAVVGSADQSFSQAEEDEQIVLALHCPSGYTVAAAQWSPQDEKMYVMEDTKDTTGWDLVALVLEQVQPNVVVMSAQVQEGLYERVKTYFEGDTTKIKLSVRASFSLSYATNTLAQVRLPDASGVLVHSNSDSGGGSSDAAASANDGQSDEDGNDDRDMEEEAAAEAREQAAREDSGSGMGRVRLALVKLGCWVNVEAPAAVSAAGGLLLFLQKQRAAVGRLDGRPGFGLRGIESLALQEHMIINQDALTSLAVFDVEGHAYTSTGRHKPALSVYGLLNTCVTPTGKRLLHTWHLRPLLSRETIAARHDAVALLVSPDNQHAAAILRGHMKAIGNVGRVMGQLRRGCGKVKDWKTLVDALMAFMSVLDQVKALNRGEQVEIVGKVIASINQDMYKVAQDIVHTIDWDASRNNDRVCVKPNIDPVLDEKRDKLAQVESSMTIIAARVAQSVDRAFFDRLEVRYLPQLGFLTEITPEDKGVAPPPGWESIFVSDDSCFYKNQYMRNMDESLGDLESDIIDIEIEIVQELVDQLRAIDGAVAAANDAIAELDCLLALAQAAQSYDLVRPVMVDQPVLRIAGGRHLLQEQVVSQYVTNSTALQGAQGGAYASMMIVTGANGSGKSAYGKQVALIAFMAQIGSFVPAQSAVIGLVDRIYTRLQTKESMSRTGSAFMIDLGQVSLALRGATERSLIILDEFGKGTNSADGAGLLTGVIEHLLGGVCPRTIILTHFHELFAKSIIAENDQLLYCYMRSVMQEGCKELTYLYKLEPGQCLTSSAAECAALHGIPPEIIERARFVTECIATSNIQKIFDERISDEDYAEIQDAEALAMRFLSWDLDKVDEDVEDVRSRLIDVLDAAGEVDGGDTWAEDGSRFEEIDDAGPGGGDGDEDGAGDGREGEDGHEDGDWVAMEDGRRGAGRGREVARSRAVRIKVERDE